jgi:hypothetical protein
VLERSSVFNELAEGRSPLVNYSINGNNYTMGYYLVDSLYPSWSTLLKQFHLHKDKKKKFISLKNKRRQGRMWSMRLECFNHVLQLFVDLRAFFQIETLKDIMTACIILHNMSVISMKLNVVIMSNSMQLPLIQCHTLLHLNLWTSFDVIIKLEKEKLIHNSNQTLWSTCGNYIAIPRFL